MVDDTTLCGMKAVCTYVDKSEKTVRRLIAHDGFPATKIGGEWVSDKELILFWRRERIQKRRRREVRD